jgi:hypothetical protein
MFINAAANSVMLQLYSYDFYNIIFKIKHTLYTGSESVTPPPPPLKNFGCSRGLLTTDLS